jgi:cytoskeletal protein CcmA (bactofilin family)
MSDLSPELNLALAVDDDDTADYLVTTQGLHGSLIVLDGLFNSTTGHAHNGAHQGGNLQFLDLTVGQNLTVNGSSDLKGSVIARQTLHAVGATTLDALLTAQSLDVTTTSRLRGAVTVDATLTTGVDLTVGRDLQVNRNATIVGSLTVGAINATAGLTITGNASVSGLLSAGRLVVAGVDYGASYGLSVASGIATTFFYQRGSASYRCWDNADFTFGVPVAANTLVQRDGTGLISDPRFGGQADIAATTYTFPTVTGNAGAWRYVKAWGGNRTINVTNGTFILGVTQYTSGQYVLLSGNSVSCYCDGANWWVM